MSKGVDLNSGNPINWDCDLNRGRVAWWLSHPSLPRGNTWRDLVGLSSKKGNNGTLTNGPVWSGNKGRPGAYGSLSFDGTDDFVSISPVAVTSGITYAVSFRAAALSGRQQFIHNNSTMLGLNGTLVEIWPNTATTSVMITAGLSVGVWYRLVYTQVGTAYATYLNGLPLRSGTTVALSNTTEATTCLGKYISTTWQFSGLMDDVSIWNRALSATEVPLDYQQSSLGHPDTLNWISP